MANIENICRWYALQVRANHEASVSLRLRELGVGDYLPYHVQPGARAGSGCKRVEPLFPGYVFANLNLDQGPRLYRVPGIIRILGRSKEPIAIKEGEIDTVRRVAESTLSVEGHPCLYTGTPIRLTAGPLAGVSGVIARLDGENKLVVTLPLLHRSLAVTVPPDWIRPLTPSALSLGEGLGQPVESVLA